MGKPFALELEKLGNTYSYSRAADIASIVQLVENTGQAPLIAVGSGGAFSAAQMACLLHEDAGGFAKAVTPLEFLSSRARNAGASVLILSAGGRNADILAACKAAIDSEPRQLLCLCTTLHSPLGRLSADYSPAALAEFSPPSGGDGFLATNSLLTMVITLVRAYEAVTGFTQPWPDDIDALAPKENLEPAAIQRVMSQDTWLALYAGWSKAAVIDLESKFSEAALGHVIPADFRNFGHGRHHWLAKRNSTSAVIAFATSEFQLLLNRTLSLLPTQTAVLRVQSERDGPLAAIELMIQAYRLAGMAGARHGIDPGRPGVPSFGSKLYRMRNPKSPGAGKGFLEWSKQKTIAITRKRRAAGGDRLCDEEVLQWSSAYDSFVAGLGRARFGALVLDYDGTLCDPKDRFATSASIAKPELARLLDGGLLIGIATGRGDSVRLPLRDAIKREHWPRVLVGYYDGAVLLPLNNDGVLPAPDTQPDAVLSAVHKHLESIVELERAADIRMNPHQISVRARRASQTNRVKQLVEEKLAQLGEGSIQMLTSSHSIDIIPRGVTKLNVVAACAEIAKVEGRSQKVLCIGDRGEWPGNDFYLLACHHALSVDTVSSDPTTCWNIAPAGLRWVRATLSYLKALTVQQGEARYRVGLSESKQSKLPEP